MENILLNLLEEYKKYSIYRNTIESDGLIPVERRILLTSRNINSFVKSAKIVGECMANYHPHSDQSIYKTLVKMVNQGFFEGQGNFGANGLIPIPPAAMRYTEVKFNPKLKFIFDYIKYAETIDIEYQKEPIYFPVPFPLLLGKGVKIGVSFIKSSIPLFSLEDLVNIQKNILGIKSDLSFPNLGEFDIIKINKNYLKESEFSIEAKIRHEINYNEIYLYEKPSSSFIEELKSRSFNIIDQSDIKIKIKIVMPKQDINNNVEYIKNNLTKIVKFSIYRWDTENEKLERISLEKLFNIAWENFCNAIDKKIQEDIANIRGEIEDYKELLKIKNKLEKEKSLTMESLLKYYKNNINDVIKILKKYNIENLINVENIISNLEKEYKKLKKLSPEAVAIEKINNIKNTSDEN